MAYGPATAYCDQYIRPAIAALSNEYLVPKFVNLTNLDIYSLEQFCFDISMNELVVSSFKSNSEREGKYSSPMVLIGIYISIASFFCVLAMALDLFNGFKIRKFWFPTKYFSLNAASLTVIAVAMKLPVDLTSPMPRKMDQVGKLVSLTFMCTMMSNLLPSLASMDNKSLVANVTGLSILVITVIVNTFIQIRTHVIGSSRYFVLSIFSDALILILACIYMVMLLFLLIILISSAITIPPSKKILEIKYQAISKKLLKDQNLQQDNLISTVDKLRQLVKRYWIMAETGSPHFVMASNPLSSASGIICAISMALYILVVGLSVYLEADFQYQLLTCKSVYKQSMIAIVVTQSIGVVVGSIAPILRCFTILSFKSFAKQNRKQFLVFKVDRYFTQKLCEWKDSRISFLSSQRRPRALLHGLKNHILRFCIGFQMVVVVSCKLIGLLPIVVVISFVYFSRYFNSAKRMFNTSTASSGVDTNEDLSKYVLLLEDNMQLAKKTVKGISDSMNRLIQKAEKKQHENLLKLLEQSNEEPDASNGVVTFDNNQFQSQLSVDHVNSWSLPIISLTCITMVIPNIHKDRVDNLFKSVGKGLFYTHLVEESLNREPVYVNIRRATLTLWHEIEVNCKWLENSLEGSAYKGKTTTEIIKLFAHIADKILNEFNTSANGELVEMENLPPKVIAANSMYRISKTIMHACESNYSNIIEDELFTRLSSMIADILVACFTNIPRAIAMRCHESAIEKRETRVAAAIDLLGQTTKIIERLETRQLPSMDHNKMAYIDEWRLHLRHP